MCWTMRGQLSQIWDLSFPGRPCLTPFPKKKKIACMIWPSEMEPNPLLSGTNSDGQRHKYWWASPFIIQLVLSKWLQAHHRVLG